MCNFFRHLAAVLGQHSNPTVATADYLKLASHLSGGARLVRAAIFSFPRPWLLTRTPATVPVALILPLTIVRELLCCELWSLDNVTNYPSSHNLSVNVMYCWMISPFYDLWCFTNVDFCYIIKKFINIQGAAKKLIPCRVLLMSQQQIGISIRKFTQLFLIHIYV